jgi:predicted regulator of Ras-like GTPase activity (Roadblock/LC7/MglB family)
MEITERVARQILLFSLLILITPMVLFPEQLGMGLAKVSLLYAVYELVYYGVAVFFLHRRFTFFQVAQAAGVCLIYRLLLGAVFGLLIAALYSLNLTVSLTLGMSSYLPAVLLHIASTPFILKPVMRELFQVRAIPPFSEPGSSPVVVREQEKSFFTVSAEKKSTDSLFPAINEQESPTHYAPRHDSHLLAGMQDTNGFDRATRYIGEDSSVRLAAVVDHEGLMLGHFKRGVTDAEALAPFSLLFSDTNCQVLKRVGWGSPEKIDILLDDKRIVVAREGTFSLMVIAHRQVEDLLTIRINRGLESIKKYMAERYTQKVPLNTERTYVRSTERTE